TGASADCSVGEDRFLAADGRACSSLSRPASTGLNWTPNQYIRLGVRLDPPDQTLQYFINGSLVRTATTQIPSNLALQKVALAVGNNQSSRESVDFDELNVTAVPEPDAAALLAGSTTFLTARRPWQKRKTRS